MEDQEIMLAVREGDIGRLEELFDRRHRDLFRYFMHLSGDRAASEDLVQEVFVRILKYRRSYQPGTPFRSWLYQIARNAFLDHAGRNKGEVSLPESAAEFRSREPAPDRQLQGKEESALLQRALAALPRDKRDVLVMSRYQNLKYEEIASVLQCEVGTVKVRVYRALRELSDRFFALRGEQAS